MNRAAGLRRVLEGLGRRTKFGILMLGAWAPVLLPAHPLLAGIVLMVASGAFMGATRRDGARTVADPLPGETPSAQP